MIIGTAVAHHTHRAHRQQHRERLPDRIVKPCLSDLVEIHGIGLAQDREFFLGDLAGDADRQSRSRKRMPADEGFGQSEFAAQRAHLVLEEFAQGLD